MNKIGPQLETLTHRLSDIPDDFLREPKIENRGEVYVPALVNDFLVSWDISAQLEQLQQYEGSEVVSDRNRLALLMIGIWLLSDEWFKKAQISEQQVYQLLDELLPELAAITPAHRFVEDSQRREELARITLSAFGFRPSGESVETATDRLSALSSIEQQRLAAESRVAEQRSRAIREALIQKAAEESADKWTRE